MVIVIHYINLSPKYEIEIDKSLFLKIKISFRQTLKIHAFKSITSHYIPLEAIVIIYYYNKKK